ncbi:hypothetical protein QBC41DRAFT_106343 [Cercophora samala]|uniref:Uncharacterized protein n=1 Tax=Cercophora samala TaxID=330535 RepID=A0AA40DDB9_9PEZI|nr:hypothetical protein QBC41DRAFT_106343 [Cercophora samala]
MEAVRQDTTNRRALLAKLLAVITKHIHWQRTYSDHCFVEAQLRQYTNRLFDGLDPRLLIVETRPLAQPASPASLSLIDPCLVPLPLEIEGNAIIKSPFVMLTTPPLTPPESTISWDMVSNSFGSLRSSSGISEVQALAAVAATGRRTFYHDDESALSYQGSDSSYFPDPDLERPYDQAYYPELPLDGAPDQIQHPEMNPGQEQNLDPVHDGDKVWQLQMQFVFRGELMEVWKWLDQRGPVLHPSHISLPSQLAVLKQLENNVAPPGNSRLLDIEAEANGNLALMAKEVAGLELLIDKMSRILHELERENRDPFVEPISVVLD